ncbi:MAG: matrixin family metalloprotease [Planctomycetes bacterium]|nr:matrixin family metalloprotease [Planctomycetota bacterium]
MRGDRIAPFLRAAIVLVACAAVLAVAGGSADAYMSIRVPVGTAGQALPVRWDLNNVAGRPNVANQRVRYEIDDLGCADAAGFQGPVNEFEAIQNSFSNWRNINESRIDFEFAGSTTSPATSATDNRNVLRWVSSNIATGVFAVTITTFDTSSGQITDADMQLNDRDFTWDTLGPTGTNGVIGRAMIESVVTHELGHFIGLDHPNNAQATMFYASSPGLINQTTLEVDDRAPVIDGYSSPTVTDPSLGTVQGTVDNGTTPQFGVYVTLVDVSTGRNVVGHCSEGTPGPFGLGNFTIDNVPPGNYLAFALPINKTALGSYYQGAFTSFFPIVDGVAVNTIGAPALVKVAPGASVTGVGISVPGASQNPNEPDGTSASAKAIASGEVSVSKISPSTDEDWFKFTTTAANQQVTIRVLSDTFGFNLNPTLTLYDTNGTTVLASPDFGDAAYLPSANDVDDAAFDLSGVNFDAAIVRTMATPGTYFFKVASRIGATTGNYLATLEISDEDTTADIIASAIESSAPGVAAGTAGSFTVTVTPRNLFGRDLNAPNTYDVELLDVTGTPTVLQTITGGSTPFTFTVNALATAQVVKYGATIDGVPIAATVNVSHYGAISLTNSRITLLESTLNANGYDRIPVMVELRDGSNNPLPDPAVAVTLSTSMGTLDNGSTTGASNIAAVFDASRGVWLIELVAPTSTGTATLTAFADAQQIDSKQVNILARATGTGGGGVTPGGGGGDDDDGGGCTVDPTGTAALLLLAAGALAAALRRRRLD